MQFISKALEAIYKLLINMRYIPIIVYVKVIKIEPEINPFPPKVLDQNIHFLNTKFWIICTEIKVNLFIQDNFMNVRV